jgi:hypothetical protein
MLLTLNYWFVVNIQSKLLNHFSLDSSSFSYFLGVGLNSGTFTFKFETGGSFSTKIGFYNYVAIEFIMFNKFMKSGLLYRPKDGSI